MSITGKKSSKLRRWLLAACVLLASVPAFSQSGTVLVPKKVHGVRYASTYATSGTGSVGAPFQGWSACLASAGTCMFNSLTDGALTYYKPPDAGVTLVSNSTLRADATAVMTWGTARASVNPMFIVPHGVSRVMFDGLRFEPGVTVPATGMVDATGGESYIAIGTAGNATAATDITVKNSIFGPMRYTSLFSGVDIEFRGSAARVNIEGNSFDYSASGTCSQMGHSSLQYTLDDISFVNNKFIYTETNHDFGYAIQFGCGATVAVATKIQRLKIDGNTAYNTNGFVAVHTTFEGFQFSNNTATSENMDFCLETVNAGGQSSGLSVTGNVCSNDYTPHNGTLCTGTVCNSSIKVAQVNGFSVTGNTVYGSVGDNFSSILVAASLNGTISGNSGDPDRATTAGVSGPGCVYLFNCSNVIVDSNTCRNPSGVGYKLDTNATTDKAVVISNNLVEDTNATAATYSAFYVVGTCDGCSVTNNILHVLSAPVGGMGYVGAANDAGNLGYVGNTLTYDKSESGKFVGSPAMAYGSAAKFCVIGSATLPASSACSVDADCDPRPGFCTADALAANTVVYAGDGMNAEGSTSGPTENPASGSYVAQKNTHVGFVNPTAVRTVNFPDESGTLAMTTSSISPTVFNAPHSGTRPSCVVGDIYFDTSSTTGQQFYICTATNIWTLQGDGGGSIAFSAISNGTAVGKTFVLDGTSSLTASTGGVIAATTIPGTGVSGNITGTATNVSGTVATDHGGTGLTTWAQGDIPYASAIGVISKLTKDTNVTRALLNTGTSNNPAWGQVPLFSGVSGTLPVGNGGTGLTTYTSGGVPYASAAGTLASSAALASLGIVVGGGAGGAPATSATTASIAGSIAIPAAQTLDIAAHATDGGSLILKEGADDGTNTVTIKVPDAGITASKTITFVTATGNLPASAIESSGTNDKCANFNASGILVPASGSCSTGGGGSGTVTGVGPGCTTGLCYTNTTLTAGTVMWVWEGSTSDANQFQMNVPANPTTAINWTVPDATTALTFPSGTDTLIGKATTDILTEKTLNVESSGNVLTTVEKLWLPAAGCNNATAASFWDLPTANAPTPTCVTSATVQKGTLAFPDSDGAYSAQQTLLLPSDWTGTIDAKINWFSAITTGDVFWQVSTLCVADGELDDGVSPAFATASTVPDTAKGTTLQTNNAAITTVTVTGCAAGELMHLKIMRDRTDTSDTLGASSAQLIGVELTLRRAQ